MLSRDFSMRADWRSRIKDLRSELELSQESLARALRVTKKTVAEWEQGRQPPSPERALQLARLAGAGGPGGGGAAPAPGGPRGGGRRPLPSADLRLIAPADWDDRFRALERLDHYVPIPVLRDAAAAGPPPGDPRARNRGHRALL